MEQLKFVRILSALWLRSITRRPPRSAFSVAHSSFCSLEDKSVLKNLSAECISQITLPHAYLRARPPLRLPSRFRPRWQQTQELRPKIVNERSPILSL